MVKILRNLFYRVLNTFWILLLMNASVLLLGTHHTVSSSFKQFKNMSITMIALILFCLISCTTQNESNVQDGPVLQNGLSLQNDTSLRWLEDIPHNPEIDKTDFKLCYDEQKAIQYYRVNNSTGVKNIKSEINALFKSKYNSAVVKKETGLVRIRFIVNCKGEADRFRLLGSSLDYKAKTFDKSITDQLLSITKSVDRWKKDTDKDDDKDYYLYILFKIIDGKIVKILP